MSDTCRYFDSADPHNTDDVLSLAFDYATSNGIAKVIVASTTGETALKALPLAADAGVRLIIVGHQYDFTGDGWEMPPELQDKLRAGGATVYFGTMPLAVFRNLGGGSLGVVADTLRFFCQGMKVAVEMSFMCADAGLVTPDEEVVTVSGSHVGADTVTVIKPSTTKEFFLLRIQRVLAKPLA